MLPTREFLDRVYTIAESRADERKRSSDRAAQSWLTNFRVTTAGELNRVRKALEKEKRARYPSVQAMLEALRAYRLSGDRA